MLIIITHVYSHCRFGIEPVPNLIQNVSCISSDYTVLFQCSTSDYVSDACGKNDAVSVTCCKLKYSLIYMYIFMLLCIEIRNLDWLDGGEAGEGVYVKHHTVTVITLVLLSV